MNKILVLLLLVSTVIGMAMPGLADDAGNEAEAKGDDSVAVAVEDVTVDLSDHSDNSDNSDNSETAAAGDITADSNAAGDATATESTDATGTSKAKGGDNEAEINIDVTGANTADNRISQALDNTGDLLNNAEVIVLGGNAAADSDADAVGSSENKAKAGDSTATSESNGGGKKSDTDSEAEIEESSNAGAAQIASGNAVAESGAVAVGGKAENGDVDQRNKIIQDAWAEVHNHQDMAQEVNVDLDLDTDAKADTDVDADGSAVANNDNDAESEIEGNEVEA